MSASRVMVTGVGLVSPLGDEPGELFDALTAGRSGIAPVELFEPDGLPVHTAGEVRGFDPRRYLEDGNLRPLDRTAQLVSSAAELALAASGCSRELRGEREVGLVLGTMFGSVRTISAFDRRALEAGPLYAKPLDFANTVINAAAGQTAIWHGLRGMSSTVSAGTVSGLQALAYAADMVRGGRARALLAGGGEELCFESFYGFARARLLAGTHNGCGPCAVPFERRRNGFALAEGAALLMLEDERSAAERGAPVVAEVLGTGSGYDPSRGRDPRRAARSLQRAVAGALEEAGLGAGDLALVSTSASGSVEGDRAEARGLLAALDGHEVPVMAIKAALGEAPGASGAFQTAALVEALARRRVPGILGLSEVEEDLPAALASAETRPLEGSGEVGLVTALGLDGHACALVLARREG